jgi:hypothetical protein
MGRLVGDNTNKGGEGFMFYLGFLMIVCENGKACW